MFRRTLPAIVAIVLASTAARAQEAAPIVRDVNQRSGLISRHIPITPNLPPDADRDKWFVTRWGDDHEQQRFPNWIGTSGLYGRKYKTGCTACYSPYFTGSPGGQETLKHTCGKSHFRAVTNIVHPFRPVCTYYAGGCYSPVYDLDPLVPGPGPFPWPFFFKRPTGG